MMTNKQLEKMEIPEIKINHLFFAMTFFIQKFNDPILTELIFKIFFSENISESIFNLNKSHLTDPSFYSFEYQAKDVVGRSYS